MTNKLKILCILFVVSICNYGFSTEITNLHSQQENQVIFINYDLETELDSIFIETFYSIGNEENFFPAMAVTGNIGYVDSGNGKEIIWNIKEDILCSDQRLFFMIKADTITTISNPFFVELLETKAYYHDYDLSQDGLFTIADEQIISAHYGLTENGYPYDLNSDGVIDTTDIQFAFRKWGDDEEYTALICEYRAKQIYDAINKYLMDTSTDIFDFNNLIEDNGIPGWRGPYLEILPECPYGGSYTGSGIYGTGIIEIHCPHEDDHPLHQFNFPCGHLSTCLENQRSLYDPILRYLMDTSTDLTNLNDLIEDNGNPNWNGPYLMCLPECPLNGDYTGYGIYSTGEVDIQCPNENEYPDHIWTYSSWENKNCIQRQMIIRDAINKYFMDTSQDIYDLNNLIECNLDDCDNWEGPYLQILPECPLGGNYAGYGEYATGYIEINCPHQETHPSHLLDFSTPTFPNKCIKIQFNIYRAVENYMDDTNISYIEDDGSKLIYDIAEGWNGPYFPCFPKCNFGSTYTISGNIQTGEINVYCPHHSFENWHEELCENNKEYLFNATMYFLIDTSQNIYDINYLMEDPGYNGWDGPYIKSIPSCPLDGEYSIIGIYATGEIIVNCTKHGD